MSLGVVHDVSKERVAVIFKGQAALILEEEGITSGRNVITCPMMQSQWRTEGVVWGGSTPPPRNSEDVGGVFDRMSKKNRRLDFLL